MSDDRYPFGRPVTSCALDVTGPRPLFVLGAYPSALHVRWTPPAGAPGGAIRAIPVDDEPEPFWTGGDEAERIAGWKATVGFVAAWGEAEPVGHLNGSSGVWVEREVLARFATKRSDAWITDCIDRYHASIGVAEALAERFAPFADSIGLDQPVLAAHPSEGDIVRVALADHAQRLTDAIVAAQPTIVVTLGNAALRVVRDLADVPADAPKKLEAVRGTYGRRVPIELEGHAATWYPLAHPASPKPFRDQHGMWRPKL